MRSPIQVQRPISVSAATPIRSQSSGFESESGAGGSLTCSNDVKDIRS